MHIYIEFDKNKTNYKNTVAVVLNIAPIPFFCMSVVITSSYLSIKK